MLKRLIQKFVGRHYRKFWDRCKPIIKKINAIEETYQKLNDTALQAKTLELKERYAQGESLEALLPEAFAVVKNAARRLCGKSIIVCDHALAWNMIHYDVQLIGGITLHDNKIAEMATGEGKTLVATLPLYLNALTGRNCQLVTINDYLARRDSEWMGYLYKFLGLTVGCIQNGMDSEARKNAYCCDITYGTASEFGFDYLRDNGMATQAKYQVQRGHYFCIVDEIDSVLIDEARTPLIISGPSQQESGDAPFREWKYAVHSLVQRQQKLCNQLAAEVREELQVLGFLKHSKQEELSDPLDEVIENLSECDTKSAEQRVDAKPKLKSNHSADNSVLCAMEKLFQIKLGMPKNRQLLRLLEDSQCLKQFEKFETEMSSDFNRERRYELKEELYFAIDEKERQADLTEKGRKYLRPDDENAFVLPDLPTLLSEIDKKNLSPEEVLAQKQEAEALFGKVSETIHALSQLLRAYCLYERDVEYVVQDKKVIIIDENTGRAMPGRRWGDGLHQAVEAKEGVEIEKETKTYATITIQNYFRMYEKLAGMTGTAETEAGEFFDIYKLKVMAIPTHKPCIRIDKNDIIYKTRREKYNAAVEKIKEAHHRGQPVLVGTVSVEASELLSKMLKREHIVHSVLNAKFHQQEADIIARAGMRGAVTIATNMAGRGTDIKLEPGINELGGLFVLGTERHESRRIDRQLRGRSARQGDAGLSQFLVSLEDDLMRLFSKGSAISALLDKTFQEGEQMEHSMLNQAIGRAQKTVEQQNFSIRKRLLQYDDVLNKQREVIYGLRNEGIHAEDPRQIILEMIQDEIASRVETVLGKKSSDADLESLQKWFTMHFPIHVTIDELCNQKSTSVERILYEKIEIAYRERVELEEDQDLLRQIERYVLIQPIDKHWQDHLTEMEELRRSVSLRGYGQKDPLTEYKSEAFAYFEDMLGRIRQDVCLRLFRSAASVSVFKKMMIPPKVNSRFENTSSSTKPTTSAHTPLSRPSSLPKLIIQANNSKTGRNDICFCGSGKKYKKCCGIYK